MVRRTPCAESLSIQVPAIGLRPPAAAARVGAAASFIEQLMTDGVLPYRLVGGARVVAVEDIDAYFLNLPKKTGALPGRGIRKQAAQ
jgi:hypothetical protein